MTNDVPRSLLLIALSLLVLRVGLGRLESRAVDSLQPAVAWLPVQEATALAEESGKPVLYDFSAHWCRPCRRMDREVFSETVAGDLVRDRFVPTRVEDGLPGDGLSDEEAAALRVSYGVSGYPTLLIVQDGEILGRQVGYPGRDRTLDFLRTAVPAPR